MDSEASKVDHEDRQDLKRLLERPRDVKPLPDKQMKVNLGPGKVEKISLKKKWEEFMLEEGGQVLLNDGILMIPVADYFKAKFNIKSVETIERMESELKHIHQDLIGKGFTEEEAKTDIKDRDKYAKYQKLKSEEAEVIVKEALEGLKFTCH